jgi:hypothetical protein
MNLITWFLGPRELKVIEVDCKACMAKDNHINDLRRLLGIREYQEVPTNVEPEVTGGIKPSIRDMRLRKLEEELEQMPAAGENYWNRVKEVRERRLRQESDTKAALEDVEVEDAVAASDEEVQAGPIT